jgi:hypothetical protein
MKQKQLVIKGGVLNSLETNAKRLGFQSGEKLLYFLASLAEFSATTRFTIVNIEGKEVSYNPTDKVLGDYKE